MMDDRECFLCGGNGQSDPLDRHHIFNGVYRKKSEKYGLVVYLCHNECHIFGRNAVHNNAREMLKLKQYGQKKAMAELHWDADRFIKEFGKNYL